MPIVSTPALPSTSSVARDRDDFDELEAALGDARQSDEGTPRQPLTLLDLLLVHRRALPFVLDPWTL
jgi:hypothetical protein